MAQLETAAVDVPSSLSMDEAAAAFADIYDDEPEGDELPEGDDDEELPEDEGDEPEAEDDSEDEADEPETPAIAPPASLNAEEKAVWAQLPPEAQQTLAAIETRRTAEVQSGLEKARNAQREATSAAAGRVAEAQRMFAEQQAAIAQHYAPKAPVESQYPNWESFARAQTAYREQSAQHDQLMQRFTSLHGEATKEQERIEAEALTNMWADVKTDLPEAADKAQWDALMDKIAPVALELGYPQELLAEATPNDIRALKRAAAYKEKADKWDALQGQRMSKVRQGRQPAKPNAAQPIGSGKARATAKATQRLMQTGSVEDAAAALAGMF